MFVLHIFCSLTSLVLAVLQRANGWLEANLTLPEMYITYPPPIFQELISAEFRLLALPSNKY